MMMCGGATVRQLLKVWLYLLCDTGGAVLSKNSRFEFSSALKEYYSVFREIVIV